MPFKTIIEPFKIKSVEPIYMTTESERLRYIREAHYNPFLLHSTQVIIDLLTDSGTSAMSSEQWAGIMRGDESYAGAQSWERLESEIQDLTGYPYILPTHQGRAAERILYSYLGGKAKIFISNTHFDTTRANIEFSGAIAIDLPCEEAKNAGSEKPFKGNMDIQLLRQTISTYGANNIAAVILTVTNNSGGGQPVSMANAKAVANVCHKNDILFCYRLLPYCREFIFYSS
jgi:tryptophanase